VHYAFSKQLEAASDIMPGTTRYVQSRSDI